MNDQVRTLISGWRVLLVEDEPDAIEIMRRLLEWYGCTVLATRNGQEALKAIPAFNPTIILCDLSMPILNGWQLLQQLRSNPTMTQIPVLALTAHAMRGDAEHALSAGFDAYLTKPIDPTTFTLDLVALVRSLPVTMLH